MQNDFITFFDAREFLTKKFGKKPSPEEFWVWCFFGKDDGGIDAYHKSVGDCPNNEYEKYKMLCGHFVMSRDVKEAAKGIKQFWYLRSEIEAFEPIDRFITADELINKWTATLDSEEEAKEYIRSFAREAVDWEDDNNPILRNYFFGALSATTQAFEPLNGVYSEEDVLAVEKFCKMRESQAEAVGNDKAVKPPKNENLPKRPKKDIERDTDYLVWVEKIGGKKIVEKMKVSQITTALINHNSKLWSVSKYNSWHKNQNLVANKNPGVKPKD